MRDVAVQDRGTACKGRGRTVFKAFLRNTGTFEFMAKSRTYNKHTQINQTHRHNQTHTHTHDLLSCLSRQFDRLLLRFGSGDQQVVADSGENLFAAGELLASTGGIVSEKLWMRQEHN